MHNHSKTPIDTIVSAQIRYQDRKSPLLKERRQLDLIRKMKSVCHFKAMYKELLRNGEIIGQQYLGHGRVG